MDNVKQIVSEANTDNLAQDMNEFESLLRFISRNKYKRLLEIGTCFGESAIAFSKLCEEVVTVDIENKCNLSDYKNIQQEIGDSQNPKFIEYIYSLGKFDVIFIDGDHSLKAVTNDFNNFKGLIAEGGIIVFHDIVNLTKNPRFVHILWNKIKGDYEHIELISNGVRFGIGILLNEKQTYSVNDITGIVCSYNTKGLLKESVDSIKKFYPDIDIIFVDSSLKDDPCREYVLEQKNHLIYDELVSHGWGMNYGIDAVKTKYALIFDSDIEMIKPCLEQMLEQIGDNVSIGDLMMTDTGGVAQKLDRDKLNGPAVVEYVHPYFMLVNVELLKVYSHFIMHGAPCINTYIDIQNKHMHTVKGFELKDYVFHKWQGTRTKLKEENKYWTHKNWEKGLNLTK